MPEYFSRNPESWSVLDFLNECTLEPFDLKIDFYIKSLLVIINSHKSSVQERESAQVLFDKYKKASKILGRLLADPTLDPLGHRIFIHKDPKPDRTKAMEWEKKRTQKQVHIQNAGTVINEINGGTFENINGEIKPMSKEKDHNESDDDFMPARIPKRKKQLSLSKKVRILIRSYVAMNFMQPFFNDLLHLQNKESAKTTKDTPSSSSSQGVPRRSSTPEVPIPSPSQGAPNALSSPGVPKPLSSTESARSSTEMTSSINENNSPEYDGPRTPPHRIFSYDTSSGASVCKEHGSKDDTSEDDLLMKSPVDITVDCKLIVKNMCVRSKMEQWRRSSRHVEEIHKQDLMRYNILDTARSSATEARNLFGKHWGDIIGTIEEFLTSSPDATSLAPESASTLASIDQNIEQDGRADDVKQYVKSILKNVNTAEKLRDVIRIECEKLRENGNTIWRKRVLDLL
ncbi:3384_t:CDS:2 [Funneliformis caledonium]|uniref:3384_t:CDS:1 n=1 Tax=Funneliformis caledonium TaxID=1117310 RepID=A0A9N9BZV3_9GLOM|nr:3384_t:CDS:2 [Funneliformis caledonium]